MTSTTRSTSSLENPFSMKVCLTSSRSPLRGFADLSLLLRSRYFPFLDFRARR